MHEVVAAPIDRVDWERTRGVPGAEVATHSNTPSVSQLRISKKLAAKKTREIEACDRLRRWLNATGHDLGVLVHHDETDDPVDAHACRPDGSRLDMQHCHAGSADRCAELGRRGAVNEEVKHDDVAIELLDAIAAKTARYPSTVQKALTLVLDVTRLPSHTLTEVLSSFQRRRNVFDFQAIYLVGGVDNHVFRLDRDG